MPPPRSRLRRAAAAWIDSNELPWMLPPSPRLSVSERQIHTLRRLARRALRRRLVTRQGWARTLSQTAFFPALALFKTLGCDYPRAPGLRGLLTAYLDRCWLQFRHNIRLADQWDLRLDQPSNRPLASEFMPCRELQALLDACHARFQGWPEIGDKRAFHRFCRAHRLPSPPVLAASEPGLADTDAPWPARDLFLKPADLAKGKGMEILRHLPAEGAWAGADDTRLTPASLPAYAARRLEGHPWLLQPRLVNSSAWQPLTPGALSTARVITGRLGPGSEPVFIGGFVRFPLRGAVVDNLSAGGIGAGLLDRSGLMSSGWNWTGKDGAYHSHPDTGAPIEGAVLPGWAELIDLALAAHRVAGDWSSVGWDLTHSTEGPLLIEANLHWAVLSHTPFSRTPFVRLLQQRFGEDFARLAP